jgi:hypothetical protein
VFRFDVMNFNEWWEQGRDRRRAQIDSPIRNVRTDLGIVDCCPSRHQLGALQYYRSAGEMTLAFLLRLTWSCANSQ